MHIVQTVTTVVDLLLPTPKREKTRKNTIPNVADLRVEKSVDLHS